MRPKAYCRALIINPRGKNECSYDDEHVLRNGGLAHRAVLIAPPLQEFEIHLSKGVNMTRVWFGLTWCALTLGNAMAMENVAPEFQGTWVPAKTACSSPLKLTVEPQTVTFVNGTQRQVFNKLDQC